MKSLKKFLLKWMLPVLVMTMKGMMRLLLATCRIEFEGLDSFYKIAKKEKCLLMFWHNRLIIAPFILSKYTPDLLFAALVSNHRDGDALSVIVESFRNGRTIRCSQKAGHSAIREMIRRLEEENQIVIITPDGPRGPRYEIKPGVAVAALKTGACVVPLNWEASRYWELNTWDRQRIPKPFSTVRISFEKAIDFKQNPNISLEEAIQTLQAVLPS